MNRWGRLPPHKTPPNYLFQNLPFISSHFFPIISQGAHSKISNLSHFYITTSQIIKKAIVKVICLTAVLSVRAFFNRRENKIDKCAEPRPYLLYLLLRGSPRAAFVRFLAQTRFRNYTNRLFSCFITRYFPLLPLGRLCVKIINCNIATFIYIFKRPIF